MIPIFDFDVSSLEVKLDVNEGVNLNVAVDVKVRDNVDVKDNVRIQCHSTDQSAS